MTDQQDVSFNNPECVDWVAIARHFKDPGEPA